jgi:hypothetical protein
MRDYPLVCIVSAADRDCRLPNNTTQAQPAAAPSAQPDGAVPAPPVAQKNEGGTASSSSGSCASSTPLCDSTDAKLPVNIFKHLTGLEHLQELQVGCPAWIVLRKAILPKITILLDSPACHPAGQSCISFADSVKYSHMACRALSILSEA